MTSIWMPCEPPLASSAPLSGDVEVDVAVVGGGITGVLVAHRLKRAGFEVAIIESHCVGGSNTGLSTGNLYASVSSSMDAVLKRWGEDVLSQVVRMRQQAVESIGQWVAQYDIDCGFVRCPLVCAVESPDSQQSAAWEIEQAAYATAGLSPVGEASGLPFPVAKSFTVSGQAQFNPCLFTQAMAALLAQCNTRVYERSPVIDLKAREGEVVCAGGVVKARHIVLATHTPLGFNLVQAEMEVYREYGIALAIGSGGLGEGIHWLRDKGRSIRSCRVAGREWLVVVGEKHKTGENEPDVDYFARLESYARARFDVGEVASRWSAQQFTSADALPYIGRSAHDNVWLATGFAADGLTWGAVAAQLICEGIQGEASDAAKLLSPRRFTPIKSVKVWAKESATVVGHLVGDRFGKLEDGFASVPAGEGRLVDVDGDRCAVYRDGNGEVSVLSPVCPHMKCIVQWNGMEKTWDCPCHGSRFRATGEVIEGPSLSGLSRIEGGRTE